MALFSDDVTELLTKWGEGDESALDRVMPLVYAELHRLANHYIRGERSNHTLQATALVHEAYIELRGWRDFAVWCETTRGCLRRLRACIF